MSRNGGLTYRRHGRKMQAVKGKPKSTRQRRSSLHTPPKEVAEASSRPRLDPYDPASWRNPEAYRRFMEGRNCKMPAHQPAKPRVIYTANGIKWYETDEEFEARRQRLATRRAGKKFL